MRQSSSPRDARCQAFRQSSSHGQHSGRSRHRMQILARHRAKRGASRPRLRNPAVAKEERQRTNPRHRSCRLRLSAYSFFNLMDPRLREDDRFVQFHWILRCTQDDSLHLLSTAYSLLPTNQNATSTRVRTGESGECEPSRHPAFRESVCIQYKNSAKPSC